MKKIHCLALITCLVVFPLSLAVGNADGQTPPQITQPQPKLTGLPAQIETKAKQITVRIDEVNANANGSGFIIARDGNTYTVLTCFHVVKNETSQFEILAPDGKRYPVDSATIKREEGVDLAVVQFTAQENYQVATLADYNPNDYDFAFLGGYPKLGQKDPKWRFNAGIIFDKEQAILDTGTLSLETDDSGFASSSATFAGGYEMVYTNISYAGMSGAPVLDSQGRVIGIHGSVEGEYISDEGQQEFIEVQLGYSLGISTSTFLGIAPRLQVQNLLPVETTPPPKLSQLEQQTIVEAILSVSVPQSEAPASQWLARANQLFRLFQFDEAVKAFEQAIQLNDPALMYLAWYGKGLALVWQKKTEEAIAAWERAISYKPNFYPALKNQSAIFRLSNQLEKALVAIDKAIIIQPQDAVLYSEKGLVLKGLKRYSQAEAIFTQAIQLSPRAAFYYNRGNLYANQQKWELALADYNQAIAINSNLDVAYNDRGLLYYNQQKWDLALADYNQAITINSKYAEAYNNRGNLYADQQKWEMALTDYNQAITINSKYAEAYGNRGLLYYNQQKWDLALADYNQAITINSKYAEAYNNRGLLYYNQQKWDLALADYNQAITINPKYAKAYNNRGNLYADQQKWEMALTDYNQAITINSKYAEAYYNRGLLYTDQQKWDLALADYNQAITINPEYAEAYGNRGIVHYQMKNRQGAIQDLQTAADLLRQQGRMTDYQKVVELLQKLQG